MDDKVPAYNLKAVIKETGLSAATLRAWERRYGLFKPKRSPGGQRLYSEEEIYLLKWLVDRQKEGLSISRAVELWRSRPVQPLPQLQKLPVLPLTTPGTGMLDQIRQTWLKACLAFNEPEAELAISRALAIATPEVVCTQVLQKGLADLGQGWYEGTVSVQQEHFASALVSRHLNALFAVAPKPTHPGRLLAACPPGEYHDLALLMLAFILRWRGWEVIYLGANIPLEQLDATLRATSPDLLLSAAQTLPGAAALFELAEFVNSRSIPLAFGGGIFNQIDGLSKRISGHFLGPNVNTAPELIDHLITHHPPVPASRPLPSAYAAALAGFREHEPLIATRVQQILQSSLIDSRYLEVANKNFTRAVISALVLGDIYLLDYSVEWLNGLLENYGVSPVFAVQYYQAFRTAVLELSGFEAGPLLEWLGRFETLS